MRILVVEDERGILDFLKKSLEADCFAVDTAEDGEKGLYLAKTSAYDLIVLDNMLPKMSGKEVCENLRKDNSTIPILMLSVATETTTKVDLLNAGADDYLTKPFSLEELLARVRALLRRPKHIENDVYQIDNLYFNAKKHIIKRGEKELHLTRKEYMLLEYLLRNRGNVVSRGMIMEHVWDMSADPFSNTIESHIMSLRRAVDGEGMIRLIHTIPGRGYMIDDKRGAE